MMGRAHTPPPHAGAAPHHVAAVSAAPPPSSIAAVQLRAIDPPLALVPPPVEVATLTQVEGVEVVEVAQEEVATLIPTLIEEDEAGHPMRVARLRSERHTGGRIETQRERGEAAAASVDE